MDLVFYSNILCKCENYAALKSINKWRKSAEYQIIVKNYSKRSKKKKLEKNWSFDY